MNSVEPLIRIGVKHGEQRERYDAPTGWSYAQVMNVLRAHGFENVGLDRLSFYEEPIVSVNAPGETGDYAVGLYWRLSGADWKRTIATLDKVLKEGDG